MVPSSDGGAKGAPLPVCFKIRITSPGMKPEEIVWDPIRRSLAESLVRHVLMRTWNRLGPRTLMELKAQVAPAMPGDDWAALFLPEVIDKTELWEQLRKELIHSVVVALDERYQQDIWPALQRRIEEGLILTTPSEFAFDARIDSSLPVAVKLNPLALEADGVQLRWDKQVVFTFQFQMKWSDALRVSVCLGD